MPQSIHSLLPILLLSVIAAASTWYLHRLEADLNSRNKSLALAPRMIGEDLSVTAVDDQGDAIYKVQVLRAVQGPRESGVDLVQPHMQFLDEGEANIVVRSKKGWLAEDQKVLRLIQAVEVERIGTGDEPPSTLSTEYLEIHPEEEVAVTPRAVRITMPGHVVDAIGMRADLARMHVELQAQVRGQHEFESD